MMQVPSYTADQLKEIQAKEYDTVAIFSGGMDSTTLVYHMLNKGWTPLLISFDYGQRHNKELFYARNTAIKLGLRHEIIDLTGITHLISNSALTSPVGTLVTPEGSEPGGWKVQWEADGVRKIEVPEGHYAEETMKATVVPNRNMIMLSIAAGVAVNIGARAVGTGVHAGDHFVYPDCRPHFIYAASDAIVSGNEGFAKFRNGSTHSAIYTPFMTSSKTDIAYMAINLSVPFEDTWSCYKGGDYHCGRCGTCVERLEAIDQAVTRYNKETGDSYLPSMLDRTIYKDETFWTTATKDK
jgi:7-cyano-7-deazaguanine synthase